MAISDINLFAMLRAKMHWNQERQRLLAENIANADTPGFRPRDLVPPDFQRQTIQPVAVMLSRTSPHHIAGSTALDGRFGSFNSGYEVRPAGNAVNLEDEMIKVAANQMEYQQVTSIYARSLSLIKAAVGRR